MVPIPGRLDVDDVASIGLEDGQPMVGVVEVDGGQPVPDEAHALERIVALRDDLAHVPGVSSVHGDRRGPVARRGP